LGNTHELEEEKRDVKHGRDRHRAASLQLLSEMDKGRSRWTRVFHNPFHSTLGECVNSCATGLAAATAGMQVAGTKARVADGTRPAATKDGTRLAAENKTAPAEQSALQ
jgi:hypothetical protein